MLAAMTAQKLFNDLFNASLVVCLLALVSSLGMSYTLAQVVAPLRRVWVIVAAVVINCVLVPAIGWGLCILFPLNNAQTTGVVLALIAAGGPASLMGAKLTKRADIPLAISLTVVLMLANIVAAPLWAKEVVSGATISPWIIIKDMCFLVLIPLAIGIFLRARYKDDTASWKAELERISNIALILLFAFGAAANWRLVVQQIGDWVLLVSVIATLVAIALGALIGLRDVPTALSGAMVTGMRFVPVGLIVISTQLHNNPAYLAPALLFGFVYTFVVLGVGAELGHIGAAKKQSTAGTAAPNPAAAAK